MSRLFVAIELPEECRARLADLGPAPAGVRWLPSQALHVTLAFLGELDPSAVGKLERRLDGVRGIPFELEFAGLDTFGRPRPTVIHVPVVQPPRALFDLHGQVRAAIRSAGISTDDKPFRPHVTVGRAKNTTRGDLRPILDRHAGRRFCRTEVRGFALFSSVLHPQGAEHEVERRWPFGG